MKRRLPENELLNDAADATSKVSVRCNFQQLRDKETSYGRKVIAAVLSLKARGTSGLVLDLEYIVFFRHDI